LVSGKSTNFTVQTLLMELGIDSFAARMSGNNEWAANDAEAMAELLERMVEADRVGLDYFGIGEHHRKGFLDAAPTVILAAAAAQTKKIRLGSAVTVLSAADPVRVFQQHATLDLISNGRAEMVAGRGSFIDAYPLFGLNLEEYDEIFIEKLDLLLKIRDQEFITWSGRYRPALRNQPVYPRPHQDKLPVWLGVGGTPASFVRAGTLGLPLMVAVIGGETHRFRPLVDLYREAGIKAGHPASQLKVGLHSLGYVAKTHEEAINGFYPGYAASMTRIGMERGWPPMTRGRFDAQMGSGGALLVGSVEGVAEKIIRHAEALGGIDRLTFQLDTAELPHEKLLETIGLLGEELKPLIQSS
jgi:probable LLM family oxidoreductase